MAELLPIAEKIEDIAEPLRGYYAERDGKFVLTVKPVNGWALEDVAGLKSAHAAEKEERRKLAERVKVFGDVDPKSALEAIEWRKKFGDLDPAKEADKLAEAKFAAIRDQLVEKHTSERGAIEKERDAMSAEVARLLVDNEATREIADQGGLEGAAVLLLPHIKARVRVRREGDQFIREVLDAHGNPRIADAKGTPFTVAQLVAEMRESPTFGLAFKGSGASGSGAGGSGARHSGSGGAGAPKHRGDFPNTAAQAAWINANGHAAYMQLPSAPPLPAKGATV